MAHALSGPPPKRSEDRQRVNAPAYPVDRVEIENAFTVAPPLDIPGAHSIVVAWYESLAESAQSKYYEPSDWQTARLAALMMDSICRAEGRPSSEMYKAVSAVFGDLLVTEGARRRLRMEIVRQSKQQEKTENPVDVAMRKYQEMMAPVKEEAS